MTRLSRVKLHRTERRGLRILTVVGLFLAGFLVYGVAVTSTTPREPSGFAAALPNPMGGPARAAPGDASHDISFAGLLVQGSQVAMGEVELGVTYVPGWEITNPTGAAVTFTVGQPQVLEGCCPGPIYADGELTAAGQQLTVPAGATLVLQFPLQMHPGMDGPHHFTVPLASGDEVTAVHVVGDFIARR